MAHGKKASVLSGVKASSLLEKLELLDQIIHQSQVYKALLKKQNSTSESVGSSIFRKKPEKIGFAELKQLISVTSIPEVPELEDHSPNNLNLLKTRAKLIYQKMTHRLAPMEKHLTRSVTPTLNLNRLN